MGVHVIKKGDFVGIRQIPNSGGIVKSYFPIFGSRVHYFIELKIKIGRLSNKNFTIVVEHSGYEIIMTKKQINNNILRRLKIKRHGKYT